MVNLSQGRFLEVKQFTRLMRSLDKIGSELEKLNKTLEEDSDGSTQQVGYR